MTVRNDGPNLDVTSRAYHNDGRAGEVCQFIGAAAWASYFVNGDDSGLCEEERIAADSWLDDNGVESVIDCGESHYSNAFGFYTGTRDTGGDVVRYTVRLL